MVLFFGHTASDFMHYSGFWSRWSMLTNNV